MKGLCRILCTVLRAGGDGGVERRETEVEDPLLAFIQQQQPREAFTRFQRQAIDELAHRFGLK